MRKTDYRRCHHLLNLEDKILRSSIKEYWKKSYCGSWNEFSFNSFPWTFAFSLHFSIPYALWDQSSMEDLSANLGFTHSQVKQRIKLICLSRAIRTSSLSFRNHMDHKLSIYLAFYFFESRTGIMRHLENGVCLPCLYLRWSITELEDIVR